MKYREAKEHAEAIAAEVLRDNFDRVKSMAAVRLCKDRAPTPQEELAIQLIFDEYEHLALRN